MMIGIIVILLFCFEPISSILATVYDIARFDPINTANLLASLPSIKDPYTCGCQCYNNALCVTGTYFYINFTCNLFSAYLWQGQIRIATNPHAVVFSFSNRTIKTAESSNPPEIIQWLFDGNFNDVYGQYNGNLINYSGTDEDTNSNSLWISPGYTGYGYAVNFASNSFAIVNQYLNLQTTSFTISAWIWIPFDMTSTDPLYFSLFSHCESYSTDKCLYTVIGNRKIRLGFFGDDVTGSTTLISNQWYHVAYVYDRLSSTKLIYLNGIIDGSQISSGYYSGNANQIILGPTFSMPDINFMNGYIDKLTFVSRVKNSTEILDEATLVAYYQFDGSYFDSGPNNINNVVHLATTFDLYGQTNQALAFDLINSSYFQTKGFYYLGQVTHAYTFSLWIYPFVNNGTILQMSSSNGWCVPMIGYNLDGQLTIQTLGSNGTYSISDNTKTSSLNMWTHVGMTYSTTNGIRLFVQGILVENVNTFYDYTASDEMNIITLGTCLQPDKCAVNQTQIIPSQFRGKIDELKIFSRELSTSEINQLAQGVILAVYR